jgi:5'-methylthioadenosine phosphorylase
MTNVPEVCLAREAEICYATISMVTNFAAGISTEPLTHAEVVEAMEDNSLRLRTLIRKAIELYDMEADCSCRHSLQAYGGFTV